MNFLGRFYQWFWFHTEWYLTPVDRRPYTFIWKDWIYTHGILTKILVFLWFGGLISLSFWHSLTALILGIISSFVLAHLVFGAAWIEGQQEYPQYIEEDK